MSASDRDASDRSDAHRGIEAETDPLQGSFADFHSELNSRLRKAYKAMAPRFASSSPTSDLDQIDEVSREEPYAKHPSKQQGLFQHSQCTHYLLLRFPPAPVELCRWPTAALRSFDPNSIRDVLRPIGLALADHFGFQVGQEHDNGKVRGHAFICPVVGSLSVYVLWSDRALQLRQSDRASGSTSEVENGSNQ